MRDDEITRLRRQMKLLQRRLRREVPSVARVSPTAVRVLGEALRDPDPAQPGRIAESLAMSSSNVAAALRELEEAGLISRRRDEADARRVLIHVTTRGREAVSEVRRERATWLGRAIENLLDEREQRILAEAGDLLERLAAFEGGGAER
jgi:DNA-binding MarR family transcriptional regulator